MKIAFLCSSMEPGRDGVGDYTRRLGGELVRLGHACGVVALNDAHISEPVLVNQNVEGVSMPVLRLPSMMPGNRRTTAARDWLCKFAPDWMSLQYVPFGFHPKGLCFGLGRQLVALNPGARWHIMFHELWLGLGENSPMKERVWGALQKRIITDLMRRLQPRRVNTQAEPYRMALARANIRADVLPLFGNIPQAHGDGWNELLQSLVAKAAGKNVDRDKLYLAGVLGAVHREWDVESVVNLLLPLTKKSNRRLALVFMGRNGLGSEAIRQMEHRIQNRADIVFVGERTETEISICLQALDLGLATSPRQIIQKSGSVAAMLEHGLQVLVTRDDWHLSGTGRAPMAADAALLSPEQFRLLDILPARRVSSARVNSLEQIARQFITNLEASS